MIRLSCGYLLYRAPFPALTLARLRGQPEKFQNKTNGVTPRRWLLQCNLPLSSLIIERIGEDWITDLTQLSRLNEFIDDESFISDIIAAKLVNKRRLAKWVI